MPGATRRNLVAALVCAGLVLQLLLVPLHLAANDHVYAGAHGLHVLSHAAVHHRGHDEHGQHRHDVEHPDPDASDGDHVPHPAEDHLEQLGEPAVPELFGHAAPALAAPSAALRVPELAARSLAEEAGSGPRPPPPRHAPAPRAPPLVA